MLEKIDRFEHNILGPFMVIFGKRLDVGKTLMYRPIRYQRSASAAIADDVDDVSSGDSSYRESHYELRCT